MANRDLPTGFVPIGHLSGGAIPEPHSYVMTASQKIYKGDPVIITSGGTVSVGAASATTTHLGIAAEYKYDSGATGTMAIKVYDDLDILYKVQTTDSLTTTQSTVFNTADIITYAAGSDITYQSIMELNTPGTSSKPWIILRLLDSPDNDWGEFSKVVVKYNQHVFVAAYAGL
jgi:hypothetical protein